MTSLTVFFVILGVLLLLYLVEYDTDWGDFPDDEIDPPTFTRRETDRWK